MRAAAVAAVAVTLWAGVSLSSGVRLDRAASPTVGGTEGASRVVATLPVSREQASAVGQVESAAPDEPTLPDTPAAPGEAAIVPDSAAWQPAVARTWVNVRSDASLDGQVVGVISPDSRALLGTTRGGWRRITQDEVSGWVDPRLFSSEDDGG